MQMGFRVARVYEAFDAPLSPLSSETLKLIAAPVPAAAARGVIVSPASTDAFLAVNRALKAGAQVERLTNGDFLINGAARIIADLAATRGLVARTAAGRTASSGTPVKALRVGLWDRYGGSMPSGWTRWILEQYEVPFTVVYPQRLDAGDIKQDYDVLIFVDGAIPPPQRGTPRQGGPGPASRDNVPAEFRSWTGQVTAEKTIPELKAFLGAGGKIIAIGSSTALAEHLDLPIESHLVERQPDGTSRPLSRDKYYVPGSLLEVTVNRAALTAAGADSTAIVMFDNSPVFRLLPNATAKGITPLAWFDTPAPLRSGWAHGQGYLQGGVTMLEAKVGAGTVYLYGPEVLFRAQPAGTYRFVMNALY
jgi:hypothetical protein